MSSILSKLINFGGNLTGVLPTANGGTGSATIGTANQVLGVNSGASALEYKTLTTGASGSDFGIANAANTVTFNLPDAGASARGAVTTGAQTIAGTKSFSGIVSIADGSANAPSVGLNSDSNATGLYRAGANSLGFSSSGTTAGNISSNGTWTIGSGAADTPHVIQASNAAGHDVLKVQNQDSTTNSDSAFVIDIVKGSATNTTAQKFVWFRISAGGTQSGSITANGANAATFTSTSDARLKENVQALSGQLDKIMNLRPVEFDYIDGSGHQLGFIAQEMQTVFPQDVSAGTDGMLEIAGWGPQVARLVAAIQDLKNDFDAYKASHP